MRRTDNTIDVIGVNGDFCRISPPGLSWGPELAPGSTGLYDMPIQTNYGSYAYGQFFQSWKPKLRNVVWTMNILNPQTGRRLQHDSDLWHQVVSRWKAMFSPEHQATVVYGSVDGERTLGLRTFDTSQSFSTYNWEKIDPHVFAAGSLVQVMAAELPFYVGPSDTYELEWEGAGNFWGTLPYFNPGTVDIWPEWECTWGASYALPDYSFFNELHGRGINDAGKTVITPEFVEGDGSVTIMTRPDLEPYVSEWETPIPLRAAGKDFEYPIPPGCGLSDPKKGCVVRALGVTDGAAVKLTLPRWYDGPFSTPLVV